MVEEEELGCTMAHASHAHADVLKEAIEMIEEMGEELSLSLSVTQAEEDEDEDEREEERGGESAADSSVLTPREATGGGGREKRDADSALGRETASAPGFRGNKKQRHHQQLQKALLALETSDLGVEISETEEENHGGDDDDDRFVGRGTASSAGDVSAGDSQSVDSRRSEGDVVNLGLLSRLPPTCEREQRSASTHYPMGPQLRSLREGQGSNREYYTYDHLERLRESEAQVSWNRLSRGSKTYCSKVHKQPCKACTTCHFCRQKTTDVKTWCPCALKKGRIIGGKSRGILCGFCLEMRYGENLDEALSNPNWRCPACRDICNCSGANCLRARRNLFPTNQLYHEAVNMGYKSVAHYLILTHLTDGSAMPMPLVGKGHRPKASMAKELKCQSVEKANKSVLRQKTKIRLKKEIEVLRVEFPPPQGWEALDLSTSIQPPNLDSQDVEAEIEDRDGPSLTAEGEPSFLQHTSHSLGNGENFTVTNNSERGRDETRRIDNSINGACNRQSLDGTVNNLSSSRRAPASTSDFTKARSKSKPQYRQKSRNIYSAPHPRPQTQGKHSVPVARSSMEMEEGEMESPHWNESAGPRRDGRHSDGNLDMSRERPQGKESCESGQENRPVSMAYINHQVQKEKDYICTVSLRDFQEKQIQDSQKTGQWYSILKQVQTVDWESLTVPQRNQRASPIVAQLPTRAHIVKSVTDKENLPTGSLAMTHEELRVCSRVLLILASVLPERQLVPMICKKVFGRAPIVDIEPSDLRAKAIIFDTSFKIMRVMQARSFELSQALDMLISVCSSFLDMQDSLWKTLSIKLQIGTTPEVKIGSLVLPAISGRFGHLERISLVRSSLEANQELLLNALSHFAALSASCGKIFPSILKRLVSRMINSRNHYLNGMRNGALGFAYAALVQLKAKPDSMSPDQKTELLSVISNDLLIQIDGLVNMHYPIRGKDIASNEDSVKISISEDTVTMSIHLLCQIVSYLLVEDRMSWEKASSYIFAPYTPGQFWTCANSRYRNLAYKLIATIARNVPNPSSMQVKSLFQAWTVCMIDPVQGKNQVQITDALMCALGLDKGQIEFNAPSASSHIRTDKSGAIRTQYTTFFGKNVLRKAGLKCLLFSTDTNKIVCDYVQAAKKEIINSGKKPLQWQQSTCKILMSYMESYMKMLAGNSSILCAAGPLLNLLSQEVTGNIEGYISHFLQSRQSGTRKSRLECLALARTQLKDFTLAHLKELISIAAHLSGPNMNSCSQCLHTILCVAFESVAGSSGEVEPFMTAFYEMIAAAMSPSLDSSGDFREGTDKLTALSHFTLGTYIRRWLQKAIAAPRQHAMVALNVMQFLKIFFTQESLRSFSFLMRLFLPPLTGPLIECFSSSESCDKLCTLQHNSLLRAAFDLVEHLVISCNDFVPDFQSMGALNKAAFATNMNLLSTVEPLDEAKYKCCLQMLFHTLLQAFLRILSNTLNLRVKSVEEINKVVASNEAILILTSTVSANNRSKMFRLLGRPRPLGSIESLYEESKRASSIPRGHSLKFKPELSDRKSLMSTGFKLLFGIQNTDRGLAWILNVMPSLQAILGAAHARPQYIDVEYLKLWNVLNGKVDVSKFELPRVSELNTTSKIPSNVCPGEREECRNLQSYSQGGTQETVLYPMCSQKASTQARPMPSQHKASIVSTKDLEKYIGETIHFFGCVTGREPRRGTKEFKSQKKFLCLSLEDKHGCVKLILTGATAQNFATALDEDTSDLQVLVVKNVKVFKKKDNGQILLQGLSTSSKHLNPNIKAVSSLKAWFQNKDNNAINVS